MLIPSHGFVLSNYNYAYLILISLIYSVKRIHQTERNCRLHMISRAGG